MEEISGRKIPIIKLGHNLIISIQTDLDDASALRLQNDVGHEIVGTGASGLVIDVSAIEIMDSYTARIFNDIGKNALLLGARTVLVGLQPAIAITLVEMGMDIDNVQTALSLEDGLEFLREQQEDEESENEDIDTTSEEIE